MSVITSRSESPEQGRAEFWSSWDYKYISGKLKGAFLFKVNLKSKFSQECPGILYSGLRYNVKVDLNCKFALLTCKFTDTLLCRVLIVDFKQASPLPNQEEILHGQTEHCFPSSVDLDGELLCFRGKFEGIHLDRRLETSQVKEGEKDGSEGGMLYAIWLCFYEPVNVEEPIMVLTSQPFELVEKCQPLVRYKAKLARGQKRRMARDDIGICRQLSNKKSRTLSGRRPSQEVFHSDLMKIDVEENPTANIEKDLLVGNNDENLQEEMLKQYRKLLEETKKLKAGLKKSERLLAEKLLCESQVLSLVDMVAQKSSSVEKDPVTTAGSSSISILLNVDCENGKDYELLSSLTKTASVPLPDVVSYCGPYSISSSNSTSSTTLESSSSSSFDDENELFLFCQNDNICKQDNNILVNDAKKEGLDLDEISLKDDDHLSWMNFVNDNVDNGKAVDSSSFLSSYNHFIS